jgi:hypothetical protein
MLRSSAKSTLHGKPGRFEMEIDIQTRKATHGYGRDELMLGKECQGR